MDEKTVLHHVALQYQNKKQAEIFFIEILGLRFVKSFNVNSNLSNKIFGTIENVEVLVYENDDTRFEAFITKQTKPNRGYDHSCMLVENHQEFINRCKKHGIQPNIVNKDGRKLVFIKDFSGNLFEIKEK